MWNEKVVQAALPLLEGRTVTDVVVGVSLVAVELDNGNVGVAYTLRQDLPAGCGAFTYIWDGLVGSPAADAAKLYYEGCNVLMRAIGCAVINAAANDLDLPLDVANPPFDIEYKPTDKVAMIGLIAPTAKIIYEKTKNLYLFDYHIPAKEGLPDLCAIEDQKTILPQCDIVIFSGTTTLNGTIETLLPLCTNAREVVIVGQSATMFKEAWKGSGVTRIAGCTWKKEFKKEIFTNIARAGGTASVLPYSIYNRVDL